MIKDDVEKIKVMLAGWEEAAPQIEAEVSGEIRELVQKFQQLFR